MADTVWAVLDNYGFEPVEVIRETKSTVFYKMWNQDRTEFQERKSLSALSWRGDEASARRLSGQLTTAKAELSRRVNAAHAWYRNTVKELTGRGID